MRPVDRSEILPLGEYETIREHFRARIIEEKKARRLRVGENVTCLFENHDTVLLQIQEMLRTERITREGAVLHEIETYNELLPGNGQLSCTAMIEIADQAQRDAFLVTARGIERCFSIEAGGERCSGAVREDRLLSDRASAVIYLSFPLSEAARAAIATAGPVVLRVDHPAYVAAVPLGPVLMRSLAEDLAG